MNLGFGVSHTLGLAIEQYKDDPIKSAFAGVVYDEIEKRRVSLGGIRGGGNRNYLLASLLKNEPGSDHGDAYQNSRPWFEFLSDMVVIDAARERLKLSTIEFLSLCIADLHAPNWETLFWMRAYLESVNNEAKLIAVSALREKEAAKRAHIEQARKGGRARVAADPRQTDKSLVRQCWDAWQANPTRYSGPTAFANDMLDKSDELKSHSVIMRWCREWKKNVTLPVE